MGLLSGFLERRRRRESALAPGTEVTSGPPPAEDERPVGQPVEGVGSAPGATGQGADLGSVIGMLGMIKDAYQSGSIQISQGPNQVADLRGETNVEELRNQIVAAMQERGIDPNASPEVATQVDASQYAGLQEDLLRVLGEHGIDVPGPGTGNGMPDPDGDGQPG